MTEKNPKFVSLGGLSWAIQREGKPLTEVRWYDNLLKSKPYKILAKGLPKPVFFKVGKIMARFGELNERDCYRLAREIEKERSERAWKKAEEEFWKNQQESK